MDANPPNKHQKNHHDGDQSSLKLCDLPDGILQEIISNLPTKNAVQTSVLSTRWKEQWKGITKIELGGELEEPEKRQELIEFMEKLLTVCNSQLVKKFSLIFEVNDDVAMLNEWLHAFVNPNIIEELTLELETVNQEVVFPENLFTSETLKKLHLSMQKLINFPSPTHFQNLVILTLKHVIFPNAATGQELFRGCPLLRELTLVDCNWMNAKHIFIICPKLEKLTIREWKDNYDDENEDEDDNADENEHVDPIPAAPVVQPLGYCQITVIASKLKTFSYDGDIINDYFLYLTNSVKDATVKANLLDAVKNINTGYFVSKFVGGLYSVGKLSINEEALKALSGVLLRIPFFIELVELRLFSGISPFDLSSVALQDILQKAPLLEKLEFDMGVTLEENDANEIIPLPMCFEMNLLMIKIGCFSWTLGELNAIKILLQRAKVLDVIYIYTNPELDDDDDEEGSEMMERLYQHIAQYPRASENCDIHVE